MMFTCGMIEKKDREYDNFIISHPYGHLFQILRLGRAEKILWMAADPAADSRPQPNCGSSFPSKPPALQQLFVSLCAPRSGNAF